MTLIFYVLQHLQYCHFHPYVYFPLILVTDQVITVIIAGMHAGFKIHLKKKIENQDHELSVNFTSFQQIDKNTCIHLIIYAAAYWISS